MQDGPRAWGLLLPGRPLVVAIWRANQSMEDLSLCLSPLCNSLSPMNKHNSKNERPGVTNSRRLWSRRAPLPPGLRSPAASSRGPGPSRPPGSCGRGSRILLPRSGVLSLGPAPVLLEPCPSARGPPRVRGSLSSPLTPVPEGGPQVTPHRCPVPEPWRGSSMSTALFSEAGPHPGSPGGRQPPGPSAGCRPGWGS